MKKKLGRPKGPKKQPVRPEPVGSFSQKYLLEIQECLFKKHNIRLVRLGVMRSATVILARSTGE